MIKTLRKALALLITAYGCLVLIFSLLYLFSAPVSTLMLARWATFQDVSYRPVPLKQISPHLLRMVVRAEDSRFCTHNGVDWKSLGQTIEETGADGPPRGASTIPMQVAKNLFLWPQQSYIRKAIELPVAMYLNALWPKSRMLEVYLSIAEWGHGIYGAEAAARTYFNKPAKDLNRYESALLAAALPNPKQRNPTRPGAYHAAYAANLLKWANADVDLTCVR